MTKQQIELLRLGITPIDDRVILTIESGLEWLLDNTTLEFDMNSDEDLKALPSKVRLFLVAFNDIQNMGFVASESIEGLSQSFRTESSDTLVWQKAEELISPLLKSRVRFVTAKRKWR